MQVRADSAVACSAHPAAGLTPVLCGGAAARCRAFGTAWNAGVSLCLVALARVFSCGTAAAGACAAFRSAARAFRMRAVGIGLGAGRATASAGIAVLILIVLVLPAFEISACHVVMGFVRRAPRTTCTCNGPRSGNGNDKCRALRQCACLLGGKGRSMPIPAQAGREQGRERPGGPPSRDRLRCVPAPAVPRNACLPPWPRGGRRPSHRPARRCIGPGPVRRWRSVHRAGGSPGRP